MRRLAQLKRVGESHTIFPPLQVALTLWRRAVEALLPSHAEKADSAIVALARALRPSTALRGDVLFRKGKRLQTCYNY